MQQIHAPSIYSYNRRLTRDADEHAEALTDWDQSYDQLSPGSFEGRLVDIWFDGLQIFRETTNRSVSQSGTTWRGCCVIGIPIAMKGEGLFSRQVLTCDSLLTFRSSQEFTLTTPENFDVIGLAIAEDVLVKTMQIGSREELDRVFPNGPSVLSTAPGQLDELRNCLLALFDPSGFEPNLLSYPEVQKVMRSGIVGHLVEVLASAAQAPLPSRSFKGRCQVVREATEYALAHVSEPVTVADLCFKLNISRRMLNYCFQEVLGTNPVNYLRSLRLNGARRALRDPAIRSASIQDVACKWGFWHLSRFAGEYRALFGELPSDTLRRSQVSGVQPR